MKKEQIHADSIQAFNEVQTALRDERLQCLQDRRFYSIAGAQWEGPLGEQFENKPKFEVNKVHLSIIRIINEYRQNRISVKFIAKDGSSDSGHSDLCAMLFRADEQDSGAEEAYDNAFEEAVGGGFGAFRLRAEYENEEDEEDERQRIRIEPIYDADSCVFFDLDAKRQDKSDAKHCWVLSGMTYDRYEEEFHQDPASMPKEVYQQFFDWLTPDIVYVAEYYKVETVKDKLLTYRNVDGSEETHKESEMDAETKQRLASTEAFVIKAKNLKTKRVHKYIMDGARILEDCGYIAGSNIPIIPVYGKRWFVDNVERCMGHVRLAKDAQRLANMQRSKLGEYAAASALEKPIFTPEQIAGHQLMWAEDHIKNYPYLLVNAMTDAQGNKIPGAPAGYTNVQQVPPAMQTLVQMCEQDIQDTLGFHSNTEEIRSNVSMKAYETILSRVDGQTKIYMSNMAKAVKRAGEVWLGMAKELMVNRVAKGIVEGGMATAIQLNRPIIAQDGTVGQENDLSTADMDVTVTIGPSSESRRQATVSQMTELLAITQDPETAAVISNTIMMNIEAEGAQDLRQYFRMKLVRMGALQPTQEEAQMLEQEAQQRAQQPDMQQIMTNTAMAQAQAQIDKSNADSLLALARSKEAEARAVTALAKVDNETRRQAFDMARELEFPDARDFAAIREHRATTQGQPQPQQGS